MNNREESNEITRLLNDLRSEREVGKVKESDRDDSTESLELCLGLQVNALWVDKTSRGHFDKLNINFIDESKGISGTMIFKLDTVTNIEFLKSK